LKSAGRCRRPGVLEIRLANRRLTAITGAAGVLLAGLGGAWPAQAASPSSGTVSYAAPTLTWTNSAPMTGTVTAPPPQGCPAFSATNGCDSFSLTVNTIQGGTPDPAALLQLVLTPPTDTTTSMFLAVYPPGCDP